MYKLDNVRINRYNDAYYIVYNHEGYCFNSKSKFIEQSNDWAYLINGQVHPPELSPNYITIKENVVPVISSFHTGVHAYAGILSILLNYFRNKDLLKGKKLLLYGDLQKGILQIIDYLVETNQLEKSDIIYLNPNTLYKFDSITLIPNSLHSYFEDIKIRDDIANFVSDKLIKKPPKTFNNISILKHHNSGVTSTMGSIDYALAKLLSKRNGYELIEPSEVGEIEVINYLNNAQKVLFSWGTTFMKNYIYISNKCKKIDVLITGHPFKLEFNIATNRDILPLKFKKARIQYHLEPDFTNLYF